MTYKRIAQGRTELDGGLRGAHGRRFDPSQPDPQLPDTLRILRTQTFEFTAAQLQNLNRGGSFIGPCTVLADLRHQRPLVVQQASVFAAVTAPYPNQQQRHGKPVKNQEFFHTDGFSCKIQPHGAAVFLFFGKSPAAGGGQCTGDPFSRQREIEPPAA